MSEDENKRGEVRQREIKPRSGGEGGQRSRQKSQGGQGGQRSRPKKKSSANRPQDQRGPKQQKEERGQPERKAQPAKKPQGQKKPDALSPEQKKPDPPREAEGGQSRKSSSRSRRSRRQSRPDPAFRAEETVEDVIRDISRIEKDIQIDIDSIQNLKLDL